MVNTKSLWFLRQREVGFREEELDTPKENEILVEALYSGISHGTERLIYRGEVSEGLQLDSSVKTIKGRFPFPVKYGYSNVGKWKGSILRTPFHLTNKGSSHRTLF
jgi:hypothetical protein